MRYFWVYLTVLGSSREYLELEVVDIRDCCYDEVRY